MKKTAKDAAREKTSEPDDGERFERLVDLTRRIVAVPKDTIDERERAYRDAKPT